MVRMSDDGSNPNMTSTILAFIRVCHATKLSSSENNTKPKNSSWRTYEVNTDRRDVGLGVGVVGKPEKQTGLSDTGISDEEELEEVVAAVVVDIVAVVVSSSSSW